MLVSIPITSNIILLQTYKIIFIITISLTKYLKYTITYPATNQGRDTFQLTLFICFYQENGLMPVFTDLMRIVNSFHPEMLEYDGTWS